MGFFLSCCAGNWFEINCVKNDETFNLSLSNSNNTLCTKQNQQSDIMRLIHMEIKQQ